MTVDFALDPQELELQRAAHELFAQRCPINVVRQLEKDGVGYQPDLWHEMAERGWLGLGIPAELGGAPGGFLSLYALYEELGRFLVPSPHLDTVALAADVVAAVGSDALKAAVLPAIAQGRCIVSAALLEASGAFGPGGIASSATRRGSDYVLRGTKLLVGWADAAQYFLCPVRIAPGRSERGVTLFLLDATAPGIVAAPLANIAGNDLFAVELDDVVAPPESVVGEVGAGWAPLALSATKAAVLQTASIVGAATAVLELTSQYAKDRQQFGGPIGRYQAVQYLVSDILIDVHSVDLLARQAAYRIEAGKPFAREAAMAIAQGKTAAAHLHRQAHEVHAGAGFMADHDLNLFSRRSKYWENNLGDVHYHHEQLARELGRTA